jgi:hypothetical protein
MVLGAHRMSSTFLAVISGLHLRIALIGDLTAELSGELTIPGRDPGPFARISRC